jgi:riboflavin synthase
VEKGSITVDGISLTVASLTDEGFEIAVIPHTLSVTSLGTKEVGGVVNLEVDVLAKYVERLLGVDAAGSSENLDGLDSAEKSSQQLGAE